MLYTDFCACWLNCGFGFTTLCLPLGSVAKLQQGWPMLISLRGPNRLPQVQFKHPLCEGHAQMPSTPRLILCTPLAF